MKMHFFLLIFLFVGIHVKVAVGQISVFCLPDTLNLSFPDTDPDVGALSYVSLLSSTCSQTSIAFTGTGTKTGSIACNPGEIDVLAVNYAWIHADIDVPGLPGDVLIEMQCATIPQLINAQIITTAPTVADFQVTSNLVPTFTLRFLKDGAVVTGAALGTELTLTITLDPGFDTYFVTFLRQIKVGTVASPLLYTPIENGCPNHADNVGSTGVFGVPKSQADDNLPSPAVKIDFRTFVVLDGGTGVFQNGGETVSFRVLLDLCTLDDAASCVEDSNFCDTDNDGTPDAPSHGRRKKRSDSLIRVEQQKSFRIFITEDAERAYNEEMANISTKKEAKDSDVLCTKIYVTALAMGIPTVGAVCCLIWALYLMHILRRRQENGSERRCSHSSNSTKVSNVSKPMNP